MVSPLSLRCQMQRNLNHRCNLFYFKKKNRAFYCLKTRQRGEKFRHAVFYVGN